MKIRLPILAGSAGGLGPTYGSPYIAMDGSYYSRPSEQTSSPVSPRYVSPILCFDTLQGFEFLIAAYMEIYYIYLIIVHLLVKNT